MTCILKTGPSEPIHQGEIVMRSKVRKCTIFFSKALRASLNLSVTADHYLHKPKHLGLQSALIFVQAINMICLTGRALGEGARDIGKLPTEIKLGHKIFLSSSGENENLLRLIFHSSRVEIKIELSATNVIEVTAKFFQKAKVILGECGAIYQLDTGRCLGIRGVSFTRHLTDILFPRSEGRLRT